MKPEDMDVRLWKRGAVVANWYLRKGHRRRAPWELDFLRGIHEPAGLRALARWLGERTGLLIKLQSIWLDKHAWASWTCPRTRRRESRELADIAVIVRRIHGGQLHRWMWILQAKRTAVPFATYTGASSKAEAQLLQEMPVFTLDGVTRPFNLASEFSTPLPSLPGSPWPSTDCPWTFLDFHGAPFTASTIVAPKTPLGARWPGMPPVAGCWADSRGFHQAAITSYSHALLSILSGTSATWKHSSGAIAGAQFSPGAPVDDWRFPEWRRLYLSLIERANAAPSTGHARSPGNIDGSVLQQAAYWNAYFQTPNIEPHRVPTVIAELLGAPEFLTASYVALSHPVKRAMQAWETFDLGLARGDFPFDQGGRGDGNDPPFPPDGGDSGNTGGGGPAFTLFVDVLEDGELTRHEST